jgi:hypothetical protein
MILSCHVENVNSKMAISDRFIEEFVEGTGEKCHVGVRSQESGVRSRGPEIRPLEAVSF